MEYTNHDIGVHTDPEWETRIMTDKYPPPDDFEGLRSLARSIFAERDEDGTTTIEHTLRRLAESKNWRGVQVALEIAYGKTPPAPQEAQAVTLTVVHDESWRDGTIEAKEVGEIESSDGEVIAKWEVVHDE
jgi:hypothetical protein